MTCPNRYFSIAAYVVTFALSQPLHADTPTDEPVYETVIRYDREEGISIQEIDKEEIERIGTHSTAGILERKPAIDATSGSRGERIFRLRGFDQRQVLVLVDGAPAYIPFDGQVDLGMVPSEIVDRITIVKGPGSVLYGPNGLGGAVEITTIRPGKGPAFDATLELGGTSELKMAARASGGSHPFAFAAFGGIQKRDAWILSSAFIPTETENGYLRENSDLEMAHVGLSARFELSLQHLFDFNVLYLDGYKGVPPSTVDDTPRYWRFTTWRGLAASTGHSGTYGPLEMDELVYLRWFNNVLDGYDDATYRTQLTARAMHSIYNDITAGGRVRLRSSLDETPLVPMEIRLWASAQYDLHIGDQGGQASVERYERTLLTIAPELELFLSSQWRAMAACQVDAEVFGSEVAPGVGPLFSVRFLPNEGLSLKLTAARRTRFPTLRERFSTAFGYRLQNPDLWPESAWHFGLELWWKAVDWLSIGLDGYDAEVDDLIERVSLGGGFEQMQNIGRARLAGAELEIEMNPFSELKVTIGYAFLYARDLSKDETLSRPAHKASFEVTATPLDWLEISSFLRITGPRPWRDGSRAGMLPACAMLDAMARFRPHPFVFAWVRATNILDTNCFTEYGFPDPGRELWVGVELKLEREGEGKWKTDITSDR